MGRFINLKIESLVTYFVLPEILGLGLQAKEEQAKQDNQRE